MACQFERLIRDDREKQKCSGLQKMGRRVLVFEMPDIEHRYDFRLAAQIVASDQYRVFALEILKSMVGSLGYGDLSGRYEFLFSPMRFATIGRYELTRRDVLFKKFEHNFLGVRVFTEKKIEFKVPLTMAYISEAKKVAKSLGYTRADGQFCFYPDTESDEFIMCEFTPSVRDLIFKRF